MCVLFLPSAQVRPVASISLLPVSVAQAAPNSKYHAFPLGYTAEFAAHLHDNIGRQFDFAEVPLGQRLNRYDIVQVSPAAANGSYIVKAAKQGDAILKVRDVFGAARIKELVSRPLMCKCTYCVWFCIVAVKLVEVLFLF